MWRGLDQHYATFFNVKDFCSEVKNTETVVTEAQPAETENAAAQNPEVNGTEVNNAAEGSANTVKGSDPSKSVEPAETETEPAEPAAGPSKSKSSSKWTGKTDFERSLMGAKNLPFPV